MVSTMLLLLMIFFVSATVGYFLPSILIHKPTWHYHPPLTQKEVSVLKDNTNHGIETNIDNLYLELGNLEVELLLEDH